MNYVTLTFNPLCWKGEEIDAFSLREKVGMRVRRYY